VLKLGHDHLFTGRSLLGIDDIGAAVAVAGGDERRREIVAKQRDVGAMRAISDA
jgi:hypothetical protein